MTAALFLGWVWLVASPPAPTRYVTDEANFISAEVERTLNSRLASVAQRGGPQVVVWIGKAPPDGAIEDWAARTFEAWGVGHKGKDDGVGIFVFPQARKLRIEVGYGLEEKLTDATASRIIEQQFVPRARAGDADGAVNGTVDAVLQTLGVEAGPAPTTPGAVERRAPAPFRLGAYAVLGVLMLILFITHPRLAFLLLFSIAGQGHRGVGGLGGGGGFGGGRSGGGGASGSW